jgi:hypothetical protein
VLEDLCIVTGIKKDLPATVLDQCCEAPVHLQRRRRTERIVEGTGPPRCQSQIRLPTGLLPIGGVTRDQYFTASWVGAGAANGPTRQAGPGAGEREGCAWSPLDREVNEDLLRSHHLHALRAPPVLLTSALVKR